MRRMDELHLEFPFAGARMLRDLLAAEGSKIGGSPIRSPGPTEISSPERSPSEERLLLHELSHRINNEFASAISLIALAAARSAKQMTLKANGRSGLSDDAETRLVQGRLVYESLLTVREAMTEERPLGGSFGLRFGYCIPRIKVWNQAIVPSRAGSRRMVRRPVTSIARVAHV
jgi:hypothetical protein